jgi:hypothetical protein
MPPGRSSWIRRSASLRRTRSRLEGTTEQERVISGQRWAAKLSQPSVHLLVQDDHVIILADGVVIASGSLIAPTALDQT